MAQLHHEDNAGGGLTDTIGRVNAPLESGEFPDRTVHVVNLVLEEIFTNIVKYSFDDVGVHDVEVRLMVGSEEISIEFVDGGREFDPLSVPPPPSRESLLDIEPGVRGILLVRKMANSMKYRREQGKNILTVNVKRTFW